MVAAGCFLFDGNRNESYRGAFSSITSRRNRKGFFIVESSLLQKSERKREDESDERTKIKMAHRS